MCLAVGWCIWISLMNLCVGLVRYSGLLIVRLGPAICSVEFPVSGDCGLGFSFVVKAVTRPGCRDDHVHLLWVVFPVYFSDCFNVVRVDLMIVFVGCFVWCEYIACFYGWTFIGNCYYICREVLTFAFCSGLWCDPWGGTVGGFLLCGLLWSGFVASFVHSCDNPLRLTEFAEILVFYVFQVLYSNMSLCLTIRSRLIGGFCGCDFWFGGLGLTVLCIILTFFGAWVCVGFKRTSLIVVLWALGFVFAEYEFVPYSSLAVDLCSYWCGFWFGGVYVGCVLV
eukprot:gene3541-2492_t